MSKWKECFARYWRRNVGNLSTRSVHETCANRPCYRPVQNDSPQQVQNQNTMKAEDYFVEDRRNAIPRPVIIDASSLVVDPEAVPSKAYADTFRMLETQLADFPNVDLKRAPRQEARDIKTNHETNRAKDWGSV